MLKVDAVATVSGRRNRSVIVGASVPGRLIAREILRSRDGYEALGFVDDDPDLADADVEGLRVLGRCEDLWDVVDRHRADTVIVSLTGCDRRFTLDPRLSSRMRPGVSVVEMPSVFGYLTGKLPIDHVERVWIESGTPGLARPGSYHFWKRALDIGLSLFGLTVFGFALPFAALAIRLDSPGPVFFPQERVGFRGRVFRLFKLRTMIDGAEPNGDPVWAETDDTRITRVGRRLRRYRFDEFPQFWNVLCGQMSVVGPRPERPYFVGRLRRELPHYDLRHEIKPGITGWAQVCQGYASSREESFEKLQFDLYYLKHRSLRWDLRIILKTARVAFLGTGAK